MEKYGDAMSMRERPKIQTKISPQVRDINIEGDINL